MTILQSIVLGLTQGATEFAPVSSSGHLIVVPWLFDWSILNDPALNKTFDVALHVGTLIGAVVYFRRDLWRYLTAWFRSVARRRVEGTDERLAWALVIGTIPGALAGALLESTIEERLGQPWLVALMLAVGGIALWLVDERARRDRGLDSIGVRTGLGLGLLQALALQPGISRSGVTITGARLVGLDRETSARFSFLLSVPIIAGAGLYKGLDLMRSGFGGYAGEFGWGLVSSAVSGFLAIWFLLAYLRRHGYRSFMVYRLIAAALILLLIATGARPATI